MFNFFTDENTKNGEYFMLTANNHHHIKNVVRLKVGDSIIVSCNGKSNLCTIESIDNEETVVKILQESFSDTELPIKIYLFQGLPKSDKMELIIQKCTELGVYCIVPTQMSRCVVKLDEKKKSSKTDRWQAIAESASKQSKRNIIPEVTAAVSYTEALEIAEKLDLLLLPYESADGMLSAKRALNGIKPGMSVGILIGPEGGFDTKEVESAEAIGAKVISLGKRILRTETAAITSVGMCMLHCEMNPGGDENG